MHRQALPRFDAQREVEVPRALRGEQRAGHALDGVVAAGDAVQGVQRAARADARALRDQRRQYGAALLDRGAGGNAAGRLVPAGGGLVPRARDRGGRPGRDHADHRERRREPRVAGRGQRRGEARPGRARARREQELHRQGVSHLAPVPAGARREEVGRDRARQQRQRLRGRAGEQRAHRRGLRVAGAAQPHRRAGGVRPGGDARERQVQHELGAVPGRRQGPREVHPREGVQGGRRGHAGRRGGPRHARRGRVHERQRLRLQAVLGVLQRSHRGLRGAARRELGHGVLLGRDRAARQAGHAVHAAAPDRRRGADGRVPRVPHLRRKVDGRRPVVDGQHGVRLGRQAEAVRLRAGQAQGARRQLVRGVHGRAEPGVVEVDADRLPVLRRRAGLVPGVQRLGGPVREGVRAGRGVHDAVRGHERRRVRRGHARADPGGPEQRRHRVGARRHAGGRHERDEGAQRGRDARGCAWPDGHVPRRRRRGHHAAPDVPRGGGHVHGQRQQEPVQIPQSTSSD